MAFEEELSIPEYFRGQSVFISGGTGLMGKVLVEKILRSCPDVANIILLIRPKKDMSSLETWSKITNLPLFEKLKSEKPESLQKVVIIPGDIGEKDLGLSNTHIKLLQENVTLVYHVAAMIQFTDSVKDVLEQNVKGTWRMLELARHMKKLKVFIHMSTAYSNFNKPPEESLEQVLPACQDWKILLKLSETQSLQLEALREKLLCGHPNPYTWSKSLAEQVVDSYFSHFPVIIMRPSIVSATLEDPLPGWIDAINGYTALAAACGYGMVRVLATKLETIFDFVPVDCAIRACIIAPWRRHIKSKQIRDQEMTTDVYNCATAKTILLTNYEVEKYGWEMLEKYPSEKQIWVKSIVYTTNQTYLRIAILTRQVLPGAIADLVLHLLGKKTIALKLTKKMVNSFRLVRKLMDKRITFPNEEFVELGTNLKAEDKAAFSYILYADRKREMVYKQAIGMRKYFFKDDFSEDGIKKNRKRFERIKMLHKAITAITYLTAGYIFLKYTPILRLFQ